MNILISVILVANILSLAGNILFTSSSLFKSRTKIIILQTSNHLLSSIAQFLQSAFSGMVQDVLLLIKNIVLLFVKQNHKIIRIIINVTCIILGLVLGILLNVLLNDNIWYGYLPVAGTFIFSTTASIIFIKEKINPNLDEFIIKIAIIINAIFWLIYGLQIKLYPVTIFNCITITLCVYRIIIIVKNVITNKKQKSHKE
ncbi:MAG: YgjV family protein [Acholeplasmatales bacterium]|nr:YgjV family protein [Acholeplasmatales bacterium]